MKSGRAKQSEIYSNGLSGKYAQIPFDTSELEQKARSRLSKNAFGYIATGAGTHQTLINNRTAFAAYSIMPTMMHGINKSQTSINLLNTYLPFPCLFAPVGVLDLAHKKGDLELAYASKYTGIPMIHSNQASQTLESCGKVLGNSEKWFQLYFSKSKDLVESFVQRAIASSCKAIVLTVDTTMLGWRTLDLQNAYLPFLYGKGIALYTSDPVFKKLMHEYDINPAGAQRPGFGKLIELFRSYPDSFFNNLKTKNPVKAVKCFIDIYSRPELNWHDIAWLRSICKVPLIIKGILHPEDANRAIDAGADGIIVSNHGGRQIDQCISSLEALVQIKKTVPENFPLLVDSGIRSGTDIFIALALGAKAVCIGRPYVYAMAISGRKGIIEYVENLASEFEITMNLTGCKTIEDIDENKILRM